MKEYIHSSLLICALLKNNSLNLIYLQVHSLNCGFVKFLMSLLICVCTATWSSSKKYLIQYGYRGFALKTKRWLILANRCVRKQKLKRYDDRFIVRLRVAIIVVFSNSVAKMQKPSTVPTNIMRDSQFQRNMLKLIWRVLRKLGLESFFITRKMPYTYVFCAWIIYLIDKKNRYLNLLGLPNIFFLNSFFFYIIFFLVKKKNTYKMLAL